MERKGGKSLSGMALSTSFTLEIKLSEGGFLSSNSLILAFLSKNSLDKSRPGRLILNAPGQPFTEQFSHLKKKEREREMFD